MWGPWEAKQPQSARRLGHGGAGAGEDAHPPPGGGISAPRDRPWLSGHQEVLQ